MCHVNAFFCEEDSAQKTAMIALKKKDKSLLGLKVHGWGHYHNFSSFSFFAIQIYNVKWLARENGKVKNEKFMGGKEALTCHNTNNKRKSWYLLFSIFHTRNMSKMWINFILNVNVCGDGVEAWNCLRNKLQFFAVFRAPLLLAVVLVRSLGE